MKQLFKQRLIRPTPMVDLALPRSARLLLDHALTRVSLLVESRRHFIWNLKPDTGLQRQLPYCGNARAKQS